MLPILEACFDHLPDTRIAPGLPLYPLLYMFSRCKCSNPRDRVYALLGMAIDATQESIYPDYDESPTDTTLRLCRLLTEQGYGIEMIQQSYLPPARPLCDLIGLYTDISIHSTEKGLVDAARDPSLPSWAPNWLYPSLPVGILHFWLCRGLTTLPQSWMCRSC
jgi:hypothetical protein